MVFISEKMILALLLAINVQIAQSASLLQALALPLDRKKEE